MQIDSMDSLLENLSLRQISERLKDAQIKIVLADYSIYLIELAMKGKLKDSLPSAVWYETVYKKQNG